MANPAAIYEGNGQTLDLITDAAGEVFLKAAGDPFVVAGAGNDGASQLVQQAKATTGTHANVAASATSVTLQAANVLRKGLTIWNDSAAILYVKLHASAASATSCTVKLVADAYYEAPYSYSGEVRGIWASATGSARIVEFS